MKPTASDLHNTDKNRNLPVSETGDGTPRAICHDGPGPLSRPERGARTAEHHPAFATTLDYLDFVFFDKEGGMELYPLEVYERRIGEISRMGFRKLYLRTSCLGYALYPSKVIPVYGDGDATHAKYPEEAARLARTVRSYDVCRETIRLCHKYGMEAWAWDGLFETGMCLPFEATIKGMDKPEIRNWGFVDPFYLAHPNYYLMRDPGMVDAALTRDARRLPIGRITCTEVRERMPLQITAENLVLYVSDDNVRYRPYSRPFRFTSGVTEKGFNTFTLDGLDICAKYVKFGHVTPFQDSDSEACSFAFQIGENQLHVHNIAGEEIRVTWLANGSGVDGVEGRLAGQETCALDYGKNEAGFLVGLPEEAPAHPYFIGVPQYHIPAVMDHQVARFAELAAYPFDGFMVNIRSHSRIDHAEFYGFNPEVRDIYRKLHGTDLWTEPYDLKKLLMIHANVIADYLAKCKATTQGRPLYLSTLPPAELGERAVQGEYSGAGTTAFERLPWLYDRYFREGSVDGISMIGGNYAAHFTPELTHGRRISLGVFRECGGPLVMHRPENYDFEVDMQTLYDDSSLDEVELYETLEFHNNPQKAAILRKILVGRP